MPYQQLLAYSQCPFRLVLRLFQEFVTKHYVVCNISLHKLQKDLQICSIRLHSSFFQ
ncbi:hypothetical protein FORC17_p081 (plasmid) [Vibrio vulnificus]|nr:hypothetical protein FORC17_p081 [Vibrio vulnificus]